MASQPRLTKGGLGLIVNANYAIENIGREVTLVDYLAPGEVGRYGNFNGRGIAPEGTWVVTAERLTVVMLLSGQVVERGIANISFCTPSHLIPLNGGDDLGINEHEDNKILEEVSP